MNNIAYNFPSAGNGFRQQPATDLQTAAYARERSLSTSESLNTGLTIKTKEGDLVTLNASSVSSVDAYLYDGAGIARTANGAAYVAESRREITLASGQSFTFTVEGDLSEEEMADIDSLLQGLDGVIANIKNGDVAGALDQVLQLDGFHTFASFAADISYQRSYQLSSSLASTSSQAPPVNSTTEDGKQLLSLPSGRDQVSPDMPDFGRLLDKLFNRLEHHRQKLFDSAAKPVTKLFNHHLMGHETESDDKNTELSAILQDALIGIANRRQNGFGRLLAAQNMANRATEKKDE